ncbi:MAG TPA: ABC transporter permease, partial [Chthoniobacterales bacterium]|nr:ABC transporter permease [Chthoniobacterales bacterium]
MITSKIASFFRNLTQKNRIERELAEELGSHVELLTQEKIKEGQSEAAARRSALIELGGLEQVKEEVRATRLGSSFETLLMDLHYGARALLKQLGFTLTAILTLAIGIGATTAIFSVVNGVMLRSLPFTDPSRIVMVWEQNLAIGSKQNVVSPANFVDWKRQSRSFESFAAFWDSRASLTGNGEPEEIQVQRVTLEFFNVLGVQPVLGRAFLPEEDRADNNFAAVLSYQLWQRRFGGDPSIVGKTAIIQGRPHAIVGVMPPGFHIFNDRVEAWLPLGLSPTENYRKSGRFLRTIGRLKDGVPIQRAQAELSAIAKHLEQTYVEY